MTILGIDPGTRRIGYGVIQKMARGLEFVDAGLLAIKSKEDLGAIQETRDQIGALIRKFKPKILAIEKLYFVKNQKTGLQVAQARGVIVLAALDGGLEIQEYGPNEIKSGITGYGFADKKAVSKMVRLILRKPGLRLIDDASDALAVAILASKQGA